MAEAKDKQEEKRSNEVPFFYPEHNVTILAKDREEADNKLKEVLAKKEQA